MGFTDVNSSVIGHHMKGQASDYVVRVHHGSQQIDTTSPQATQGQYNDLKSDAGVSQAAFDSRASAVYGDWYDNRTSEQKAAIRVQFQRQ